MCVARETARAAAVRVPSGLLAGRVIVAGAFGGSFARAVAVGSFVGATDALAAALDRVGGP